MRLAIPLSAMLICQTLILLVGCSSTVAPADGVEFQSEDWDSARDSGFAISPVVAGPEVPGADEITAQFTDELFASLEVLLPESALVSPEQTLRRLHKSGHDALSRLRLLRRALHQNEELNQRAVVALSRDLEHRYALVGWLEETASEVTTGGGYYSYGDGDAPFGSDVERTVVDPLRYQKVEGTATVAIVDLWEGNVLWRGGVSYETTPNDDSDGNFAEALVATRASAALRLADYIAGQ